MTCQAKSFARSHGIACTSHALHAAAEIAERLSRDAARFGFTELSLRTAKRARELRLQAARVRMRGVARALRLEKAS